MNKARVYDIKTKQDEDMINDMYLYLYNNYKRVALEEGYRPVPLSEFINQLWNNIEQFKRDARA